MDIKNRVERKKKPSRIKKHAERDKTVYKSIMRMSVAAVRRVRPWNYGPGALLPLPYPPPSPRLQLDFSHSPPPPPPHFYLRFRALFPRLFAPRGRKLLRRFTHARAHFVYYTLRPCIDWLLVKLWAGEGRNKKKKKATTTDTPAYTR